MKIKDLKPADYNPRKITDEKLQMLKKALEEFGDLSGIIFNRQTGNLIGGHQRLKCLPPDAKIEKIKLKKPSRTGTIAEGKIIIDGENYTYREVDWPIEKEKAANLAANHHRGEDDDELLSVLVKELSEIPAFDANLIGFDNAEIDEILNAINIFKSPENEEDKKNKKVIAIRLLVPPQVWLVQKDEILKGINLCCKAYGIMMETPE